MAKKKKKLPSYLDGFSSGSQSQSQSSKLPSFLNDPLVHQKDETSDNSSASSDISSSNNSSDSQIDPKYADMFVDSSNNNNSNDSDTSFSFDGITPSSSSSNSSDDDTGFWGTVRKGEDWLNTKFDDLISSNPITSGIARAGQSAADVMTGGNALKDKEYSTGSDLADSVADFIGGGIGFSANLPGANFSIGNAMNKVIGQPTENALNKLASKYDLTNKATNLGNRVEGNISNLANNVENKWGNYALNKLSQGTGYAIKNTPDYITKSLKTGAEFGLNEGINSAVNGQDVGEAVKEGFEQGALWGAGGKLVGDAFTHYLQGKGKVKVLNDDGQNVRVQDEAGNIHDIDKTTFDSTAQTIPKSTIDSVNTSNDLSSYTAPELLAAKKYNDETKNSMSNMGLNPDNISNNAINNELKTRLGKPGGTTYTVKNTAPEQAQQKLQDAMDAIGNHFGTNKLTPEEMARIKPELGIDLEQLVKDAETAKTDIRAIGDRQRLRQVAGVDSTTFNPVKETTTEQIPYVRTYREPTAKEQVPSVMTYKENVPVTANEQVPLVSVKKERNVDYQKQETGLPQYKDVTNYAEGTEQIPVVRSYRQPKLSSEFVDKRINDLTERTKKILADNNGQITPENQSTLNNMSAEFKKLQEMKNNRKANTVEDNVKTTEQPQTNEVALSDTNIPVENNAAQNASMENITHKVNDEVLLNHNNKLDAGTIHKINNDGTVEIQRPEGDYVLAKKNGEQYESIKSQPTAKEQLPIDERDNTNVGNRKVQSYQYLHPELKHHIQDDAKSLLDDLKNTSKGEKGTREDGTTWGQQRVTSGDIAYLRDQYKMGYKDIEEGLNKLISDDGKENNAKSKKIELVIDSRLSNGYKDMMGNDIEANKDYVSKKNDIEGSGQKLNTEVKEEKPQEHWQLTKAEMKKVRSEKGWTEESWNPLGEIQHKNSIKSALIEGKNVPEEVLKEYPGIKEDAEKLKSEMEKSKGKPTAKELSKQTEDKVKEIKKQEGEQLKKEHEQELKQKYDNSRKAQEEAYLKTKAEYVGKTRGATKELLQYEHEQSVRNALKEGRQVPEEVAKDYPELTKKEEAKQENPLTTITKTNSKIRKGEPLTAEEVKNHAEYIMNNEDVIKSELSKLKNAELDKMIGWRAKDYTKKQDKVEHIYNNQLNRTYYDIADTDTLSGLSYGGKERLEDQMKGKIKSSLEKLTQEKLDSMLEKKKSSYNKAAEERKAKIESIKNPTTLEDFELAKRVKKLSTEEQRQYEELKSLDIKAKEKEKGVKTVTNLESNSEYDISKTQDTRDKRDLWVVKFKDKSGDFKTLNKQMKDLGGAGYSRFTRGFNFYFDPTEKLNSIKKGDVVETAKEEVKPSRKKEVANKLRTVADNMQSTIDNKFADRQTNTARRASMAANAEAEGEALKKQQKIIRNIADLIESGEAKHLDGVTAKTHIETLEGVLRTTKNKLVSKMIDEKYPGNSGTYETKKRYEQELKDKPEVEFNSIDTAEYPLTKTYDETLKQLTKETVSIPNTARLRQKIDKAVVQNKVKGEERYIDTKNIAEDIIELYDKLKRSGKDFSRDYDLVDYKRLQTMGIKNTTMLRAALREFQKAKGDFKLSPEEVQAKKVKELERGIIGKKFESYFPTPKKVVDRMLEEANIKDGESILEPSAGSGHIADMIKAEHPKNNLEVGEYNNSLSEILKAKGHNVVSQDFLEHKGQYDKIIMNPPFEKNQDVIHVQHAYEQLKPGGRIVAIMSEHPFFANDKKSVEFREWLDGLGGTSEKLPEGSFKESDRSTGVNTRLVVIDKPESNQVKEKAEAYNNVNSNNFEGAKVETPEFKKWFGDSKVTDEKGNPLVVYHGSTFVGKDKKGISTFGGRRNAFWFAKDAEHAETFAMGGRKQNKLKKGANITPVYLKLENPLDLRSMSLNDQVTAGHILVNSGITREKATSVINDYYKSEVEQRRKLLEKEGLLNEHPNYEEEVADQIRNGKWDAYMYFDNNNFVKALKDNDIDGLVWKELKSETYAVFSPNQIKSSIGNNSKFDLNSKNILEEEKQSFIEDGEKSSQQKDKTDLLGKIQHLYKNKDKEAMNLASEAIESTRQLEDRVRSTGGTTSGNGIKTVGVSFSKELAHKGYVELRGRKVNDVKDVAVMGQIFRNPQYETFRIIYTRGNEIVGHEAMTSRIPGSTVAFLKNKPAAFFEMNQRMKRMKADGYYLLHNHPSGEPTPSKPDLEATKAYRDNVKGFKGHVVINSEKYATIGKGLESDILDLGMGEDKILKPSLDHPLLGETIKNPQQLAITSKELQLDSNQSAVFYMDSKLKVRAIQEIPSKILENEKATTDYLRGRMKEFGSTSVFVNANGEGATESLSNLVRKGHINDALINTKESTVSLRKDMGIRPDKVNNTKWMGKDVGKGVRVNETEEKFRENRYREQSVIKKTTDRVATNNPKYETVEKVSHETKPVFSGYKEQPYKTVKKESTPVWKGYEAKELGEKPKGNKVSGYKEVIHETTKVVPQSTKYSSKKMPSLMNPKKPIIENEKYNLKNIGEVTVKSINGKNVIATHKSGKDITISKKTFNDLNRTRMESNDVKVNDVKTNDASIDFNKIDDANTLKEHISNLKTAVKEAVKAKDNKKVRSINLQLFAAEQRLKQLKDVVRPNMPENDVKIVSSKNDSKFSFKNSWNKFYTRIVDTNKPTADFSKVSGDKAYIKSTNSKNVGGVVDHILTSALVDMKGKKIGNSLRELVNQVPKGKENEFWEYMLHRHNVQRYAENKPVYPKHNSESSQNIVNEFEKLNPDLKRAGDNVTKWLKTFMEEWGHKSGLISDDLWNSLKKKYPNYIPTNRSFTELEGGIEKTNGKGFVDQSTPLSRAQGSDRDIKNPVENIMNLVNRTVRTAKYNEVGQEALNSIRQHPTELQGFAEIIPKDVEINHNHDNIVTVLENGERVNLQINNKPFLDALKAVNKSDLGDITRKAKAATNLFKALITTKNPLFAISNVSRDIPTYMINSKENNPLKAVGNLGSAFKDVLTNAESYQKYKGVGGGGSNFFDSEKTYKSAAQLRKEGLLSRIGNKVEAFNNALESAPRLAEFKRTLAKTGDIEKALFDSNEVTTNFSRGGDVTKKVDAWVPYLNASIQGLDKLVRQFKGKKAIPTVAKGLIGVTSLSVLQNIVNADNPNYDKLDNRTKDTYYLIPYGDKFIKIPKSREYGVIFGSLFERIWRKSNGDDEAFKGFGNTIATNFSPTDPIENNIFSPLIYNLPSNKDFAGRAIVPQSIEGRSAELQYDEKTSEIGKLFGKLGLSPKQVDYVIKSYTGVIGQFVLPMTTLSNTKGDSKLDDILSPVTTRFTADPLYNNQDVQDFYDNMQKSKTAAADKNFSENIDSKVVTHEENVSSEFTKANKTIADLSKQVFEAMQNGETEKVKSLRQQIIDTAAEANKLMNGDSSIVSPTELKSNIEDHIKYNTSSKATYIRQQADLISKANISLEKKSQLLQSLSNKAAVLKKGKAPTKKKGKANPYDN